jgi:hypothetical protein
MGVKYGKLNKKLKKLLVLEMDFWHKSARSSRRENVTNEIISISKEWIKKITSKDFKLDTYWKKEKETRNKSERRCNQNYGRTMNYEMKTGRTNFVGDLVSKDIATHHRMTIYIHTRHVQKLSSDRAYGSRRWRKRGAPEWQCLRSREGYIRHIVSSHSLFIRSSFCLEMSMKIENPTSCEIWSVIKFLKARNVCLAEIHRQVCEVYGENAMSDGMVRRWCRMFSEGRTNVHVDDRSSCLSLVTADLLDQVNEEIRENRGFTFLST